MKNSLLKRKIIIAGETTYDIIFKNNVPVDGKVGGSQLNSAISLSRMGMPATFISELGSDRIGDISLEFLISNGVDVRFISRINCNSRLALAFLNEMQDAQYTFYHPAQSNSLHFPDVDKDDIVLFGSSFARRSDIQNVLSAFLEEAKLKGAIIIYDPNYRITKNADGKEINKQIVKNLSLSTIIKGSNEDFMNIFGTTSGKETAEVLRNYTNGILVYTRGEHDVEVHLEKKIFNFPTTRITPVSTIGAGDNFSSGLIYGLVKLGIKMIDISSLPQNTLKVIISYANAFASAVCQSMDNYVPVDFVERIEGDLEA